VRVKKRMNLSQDTRIAAPWSGIWLNCFVFERTHVRNSALENALVNEYFVAFLSPSGKFPGTALNGTMT